LDTVLILPIILIIVVTTVLFTGVFLKYRSDPCVVAVARVVLEMIFVRNGLMSLSLGLDFADVNSFITLLCTSCTI